MHSMHAAAPWLLTIWTDRTVETADSSLIYIQELVLCEFVGGIAVQTCSDPEILTKEAKDAKLRDSWHVFSVQPSYFQHSHVFGECGGCCNLTPSDVCIVVLYCELFANLCSFSTDRHNPTQTVYMLHSTNTIYIYINMCLQAVCRHVCLITVDTWIDVPFSSRYFFTMSQGFQGFCLDWLGWTGRCDMWSQE